MSAPQLLPLLVYLFPLLGAALLGLRPNTAAWRVRQVCVVTGLGTLLGTLLLAAGFSGPPSPGALLGVDSLSALLLPITAAVGLGVLWSSPLSELTSRKASLSLVALAGVLGTLVSLNVIWLAAFWTLSLLPLYFELRRTRSAALPSYRIMLWLCVVPLWGVVAALAWPGVLSPSAIAAGRFDVTALASAHAFTRPETELRLGALLLVALLGRIGCFPLHIWMVPVSARGPVALSLVTYSTPLGIFLVPRLLLPLFPSLCQLAFPLLLPLAVLSALYAAIVGLGQTDSRRALGYFWMSQQGFLLAGLSSLSVEGVSGALLHALATVVVRVGLVLSVLAIASRTGTSDVRLLGGLAQRAPRLSALFLVLSVAAIGIPGTAGFVSEDLIVQGLVWHHPVAAVLLLTTTALNGILLFRLHHSLFLGLKSPAPQAPRTDDFPDLLPRERWVTLSLIGLLFTGGLVSAPLLAVRGNVIRSLQAVGAVAPSSHESAHEHGGG